MNAQAAEILSTVRATLAERRKASFSLDGLIHYLPAKISQATANAVVAALRRERKRVEFCRGGCNEPYLLFRLNVQEGAEKIVAEIDQSHNLAHLNGRVLAIPLGTRDYEVVGEVVTHLRNRGLIVASETMGSQIVLSIRRKNRKKIRPRS